MKKDTIVRTIVLALALINQIFALVGIPQLTLTMIRSIRR